MPRRKKPPLAKISGPRLTQVVPRERLFLRMDQCLEHAHVWLTGMPGAGKTALVASYLQARAIPALWYQVDAGDADPAVLCHFLRQAAADAAPDAAKELVQIAPEFAADLHAFGRHYFRGFYACVGARSALVLDNCQEALGAGAFRKLLLEALREAPPGVRVIVASRVAPPREFARLRANGLLASIEPDELAFTLEEAAALSRLGVRQRPDGAVPDVARLTELTRGWAAGLKLLFQAAVPAKLEALHKGRGIEASLFDYLATEVFDRQREPIRDFLMKVALLPCMSPVSAEQLSGNGDAGAILEAMQQSNNFTYLHGDGASAQYEFHPLLRGFLLDRARNALEPTLHSELVLRAAAMLETEEEFDAAAHLLVQHHQWPALKRLVLSHAVALLARGWHSTLTTWLSALPQDEICADPWICYWRGAALAPFDLGLAQQWFERACHGFRAQQDIEGSLLAWSGVVEVIAMQWADFSQLDKWIDAGSTLLAECPHGLSEQVAGRVTASMFAALLFRRTESPEIEAWAARLLSMVETCPDPSLRILLGCNLHVYYTVCIGENALADRLMKAVEPPSEEALGPVADTLLRALRSMHLWWRTGNPGLAIEAADASRKVAQTHGIRVWDFLLNSVEAYAWLHAGDAARAKPALARLRGIVSERCPVNLAHYHYLACLAALISGDADGAVKHIATTNDIVGHHGGPVQHALCALAQAQAYHAAGNTQQAKQSLARGMEIANAMRSGALRFQGEICAALFALDGADEEGCATALRRAFALGAAQDYLNYNYFRPDVMARLCAFALEHDIETDYARRLIRERQLKPPGPQALGWPWRVKIFTLGRFSVAVDGVPAQGDSKSHQKPLELLQALIALGGRDVGVASLVETLWPEAESKGGRGAFEATLLCLRRLLKRDDMILSLPPKSGRHEVAR